MKLSTRKFGDIEVEDEKVLTMPEGLLGFETYTQFVLLEEPATSPFCWFQSVEEANLALVVINPFLFKPDYHFDIGNFIQGTTWDDVANEKLSIYVVVNISGEGTDKKITANLIGPIVIDPENKSAVQVVIPDMVYSHQHNLLENE